MTAEELLSIGDDGTLCIIDTDTRCINIPASLQPFGVESDENSKKVRFKMNNIFGDITGLRFCVNYRNPQGGTDSHICTDVTLTDGYIEFVWTISRYATMYSGDLSFIVCIKRINPDAKITYEWNTTLAKASILGGLECPTQLDVDERDLLTDLINETKTSLSEVTKTELDSYNETVLKPAISAYANSKSTEVMDTFISENEQSFVRMLRKTGTSIDLSGADGVAGWGKLIELPYGNYTVTSTSKNDPNVKNSVVVNTYNVSTWAWIALYAGGSTISCDLDGISLSVVYGVDIVSVTMLNDEHNSLFMEVPDEKLSWVKVSGNKQFTKVCYGFDKFVALDINGKLWYSVDGVSWTEISSTLSVVKDVCCNAYCFMAIGVSAGDIAHSNDGIAWVKNIETQFASIVPNSICCSDSLFVISAQATGGPVVIYGNRTSLFMITKPDYYSSDNSWYDMTADKKLYYFESLDMFMLVTNASPYVSYFENVWMPDHSMARLDDTGSLCYGLGIYVKTSISGFIYYSHNGHSWHSITEINTLHNSSGGNYKINHVTYRNGLFVAVGDDGLSTPNSVIFTSTDGINWSKVASLANDTVGGLTSICYGGDRFVAVGNKGTHYYAVPKTKEVLISDKLNKILYNS